MAGHPAAGMTPEAVRLAFNLPPAAAVDRRVPKNAFMEQIAGAADRKQFDQMVERLDWLAALAPATIGVATATIGEVVVEEVQLFALTLRKEATRRLLQVVHQTVPYPLIMVSHWPGASASRISLWARHRSDPAVTLDLATGPETSAFLAALDLARLPRTDLGALYDGLIERAQALWASQLSGGPFRLPASVEDALARQQAIAAYLEAEAEWRRLKALAKGEKRLARAVELGEKASQAKAAMECAAEALRL